MADRVCYLHAGSDGMCRHTTASTETPPEYFSFNKVIQLRVCTGIKPPRMVHKVALLQAAGKVTEY